MYEYYATVVKVVDGDTVDLDIDLGLNVHVFERVRLYGIDTPEVRGKEREDGLKAKEFLISQLWKSSMLVRIQTIKDKKGKYGRYLARLFQGDGEGAIDINQLLVDSGHAKKY